MSETPSPCALSVVIPACNEEGNIGPLLAELRPILDSTGEAWEIVFVDDGSHDQTWQLVAESARADARIRGIRLSRNFGHQVALLAGLGVAAGRAIISMDGDLQHPPALIPDMLRAWREGYPIVATVRDDGSSTGLLKRATSRWFYRLFSRVAGVPLAAGSSDFRLLDRKVLVELLRLGQSHLFLRAGVSWLGFASVSLPFTVRPRHRGRSKYSLGRMRRFAVAAVLSYSTRPLLLGIGTGLVTGAAGTAVLAYAVACVLRGGQAPELAWILGALGVLFGLLFLLLGVIGAYLARIHHATMQRPLFVVSETVGLPRDDR